MKKFLSIVAVLALVFALAVPAFAADPSINYASEAGVPAGEVTASNGDKIQVDLANPAAVKDEEKLGAAVAAVEGAVEADVIVVNNLTNPGEGATVTIVRNDNQEVVGVLIQETDGSWTTLAKDKWTQKLNADGKTELEITFPHLSTVALALNGKELKADTSKDTSKDTNKTAPAAPGKKSPQTGYNVALLSVAAVAMALCAGYCFTRKVTE